jgi:4-hydroxy-2-oxoheptanedioate aldolase
VGIDCQHSTLDESAAATFVRGWRSTVWLGRVGANTAARIGKLLDAGVDGVIVPGVDNAEEAAEAVASCRYPPIGVRSFGPIRAGMGLSASSLEDVLCLPMIETISGLENVELICSVPGVSGVYIGPADLSVALGLPVETAFSSDQLADQFRRIARACDEHDLLLGAHAVDAASARRWEELGCRYVSVGSDVALLNQAARRLKRQLVPLDPADTTDLQLYT